MINNSQSVERAGIYPFQRIQDELFIVDPRAREMHQLNEVGARIWDLIAQPRSVRELADVIADEYDVGTSTAQNDVAFFLDEMIGRKLARVI